MNRHRDNTYDQNFRDHLREHPQVLDLLTKQSKRLHAKGVRKTSVRFVWEGARHDHPELGGLNDHLHSRYSRLIMEANPELEGFFYTRRLRTE